MFDPVIADVPVTAKVGVERPEITTLLTLVGVIAPRLKAMVPLDVIGEPLTPMPFAPLTATDVTVPEPPDAAIVTVLVLLLVVIVTLLPAAILSVVVADEVVTVVCPETATEEKRF